MDLKNRFRFKFIIFLILVPAVYQAQELEKKRFVMTSLASPELVTTIDSLIRTLDGVVMLRVDFPTKNCVGLFNAEQQYNQQTFSNLLEPSGIGVKCYTSEVFTGQPMPPVDATDCRGNPIPELLPERGIGACCSANGTPGCENLACETFVCGEDGFCCASSWDNLCANIALVNAGIGGPCSSVSNCPGPAACCSPNGSMGCGNSACQNAVCSIDIWCCEVEWDGICADYALQLSVNGPCTGVTDCPGEPGESEGDCDNAINICTDINFSVDPNGYGNTNEIPPLGSSGNPSYGAFAEPVMPWGSPNMGCLRSGELNSTWMIVNVESGGVLEFTFGGLGTQSGFYDWIMYPYDGNTCTEISSNQIAPVRCNWNGFPAGGTGLASTLPPGGDPSNFEPPLNVNAGDQFVICFSNYSSVFTSVPLQFGGSAGVSCTPLPVELKSFSAKTAGLDVKLHWTTATEINNDQFFIQRSTDGSNWKEIASISGNGFSTHEIHYEHIDKNPPSGYLYYRLFQQDFNGSPEMIGNAAVDMGQHNISVYPNPSKGDWCISGIEFRENLLIELNDIRGRIVPVETAFQNQQLLLKMRNHKPGMYFLKLTDKSGRLVELLRIVAIE